MVRHIAWSYDVAPTAGSITVTAGGSTVFKLHVTAAGPGATFREIRGDTNKEIVITLAAGGASATGIVNADWETA